MTLYADFDPVQKLGVQLGFLQRSCRDFDLGCLDEGVRVAAILRTLFRDTFKRDGSPMTVSVLTHIANIGIPELRIVSSVEPIDQDLLMSVGNLSKTRARVENGAGVAWCEPLLEQSGEWNHLVSRQAWWKQDIYLLPGLRITRENLVLAAAEQDGGVHVDAEVSASYQSVRDGVWEFGGAGLPFAAVADQHLCDLRQLGHELLSSPDLMRFAQAHFLSHLPRK